MYQFMHKISNTSPLNLKQIFSQCTHERYATLGLSRSTRLVYIAWMVHKILQSYLKLISKSDCPEAKTPHRQNLEENILVLFTNIANYNRIVRIGLNFFSSYALSSMKF